MATKGVQWSRQRELKKQDIPTPESMINTANQLGTSNERALFALLYLTGGRCTEVVKCPFIRKNHFRRTLTTGKDGLQRNSIVKNEFGTAMIERYDKIMINYPGICKKDITFGSFKETQIMTVSMQNRKNKKFIRKNIPVTISKDQGMVSIVKEYLETLSTPETPLFDFGIRKAEYIMGKTQFNPHFLRDIRLTHMVMLYNFNAFQLAKFAGWKDIKSAERYVRLGVNDIIY